MASGGGRYSLAVADVVSVAVVTRTQDRTILLDRAIRSVMQQTLPDLHMIIVNDGGDPRAVEEVVEALASEVRGRVTVVHHDAAQGMEAATNAGLRAGDSQFVTVLDDDDSWHPRFLERTVGVLESTGAMGIVTDTQAVYEDVDYGDVRFLTSFPFDPMDHVRSPSAPREGGRPPGPNGLFGLLAWNQFPPSSFVYRRSALGEVGIYDESLPVLGDWDFNIRFARRYDIHYIAQPLAYYHQRKGESGESDNSVSRNDLHDRVRGQLLDRYLRHDLERGTVGVGVLTNALHEWRRWRSDDLAAQARVMERLDSIEQSLGELVELVEHLEGPAPPDGSPKGTGGDAAIAGRPLARARKRLLGGSSPDVGRT
jgi:glycosyltransferase involved in cell wall biosynthesis